ncbi:MAG: hypothetical protein J5757_00330 [Lachnospiraceae bacterium]|nr:hypothetical protein [Lachnospiraceae bacterium]
MFREVDVKKEIEFLESQLRSVSSEVEKIASLVPDGAGLRVISRGEGYQYFMRHRGSKPTGDYIAKKDREKAETLAQIEYDRKLIKSIEQRIAGLKQLSASSADPFEDAFGQMVLGKRELIRPHRLSDEAYIREWKNKDYDRLEFGEKTPEYYTRQGLRVRSKSEVIIADILDEMSIPFLYEKPLQIGSGTIHPDFTLLNIKERRELYWEHFGMMDEMDYRNNAFLKIRKYESTFRRSSLIWTFETERFPLNTKAIRNMVSDLKADLGY